MAGGIYTAHSRGKHHTVTCGLSGTAGATAATVRKSCRNTTASLVSVTRESINRIVAVVDVHKKGRRPRSDGSIPRAADPRHFDIILPPRAPARSSGLESITQVPSITIPAPAIVRRGEEIRKGIRESEHCIASPRVWGDLWRHTARLRVDSAPRSRTSAKVIRAGIGSFNSITRLAQTRPICNSPSRFLLLFHSSHPSLIEHAARHGRRNQAERRQQPRPVGHFARNSSVSSGAALIRVKQLRGRD